MVAWSLHAAAAYKRFGESRKTVKNRQFSAEQGSATNKPDEWLSSSGLQNERVLAGEDSRHRCEHDENGVSWLAVGRPLMAEVFGHA